MPSLEKSKDQEEVSRSLASRGFERVTSWLSSIGNRSSNASI